MYVSLYTISRVIIFLFHSQTNVRIGLKYTYCILDDSIAAAILFFVCVFNSAAWVQPDSLHPRPFLYSYRLVAPLSIIAGRIYIHTYINRGRART